MRSAKDCSGRALGSWIVFALVRRSWSPELRKLSARRFPSRAMLAVMVIFAALFLLPAVRGWGLQRAAAYLESRGFRRRCSPTLRWHCLPTTPRLRA